MNSLFKISLYFPSLFSSLFCLLYNLLLHSMLLSVFPSPFHTTSLSLLHKAKRAGSKKSLISVSQLWYKYPPPTIERKQNKDVPTFPLTPQRLSSELKIQPWWDHDLIYIITELIHLIVIGDDFCHVLGALLSDEVCTTHASGLIICGNAVWTMW